MTEAWREEQLEWLARGHEVRRLQLNLSVDLEEPPQPGFSQIALLHFFIDALDEKTTPTSAAKQISEWVLSVPDSDICYNIYTAYMNMIGVLFAGARQLSSRKHLKILADLTVELANLPDAYNNTDMPIEFEGGLVVQIGERIELPCQTGTALWSGLPDFALMIRDHLNAGPPQFFHHNFEPGRDGQQEYYHQAEDQYTNINTFAAMIAQQHPLQESPLSSCVDYAFAMFAFLENGPDTARGRFSHLVVRAAATWLTVAGKEVVISGSPFSKYNYTAGSLWAAEGGTNTVDVKRLYFWKDRFRQLRESGRLLSQDAIDATIAAAAVLDSLIAAQG
jgi:hypothetical protein